MTDTPSPSPWLKLAQDSDDICYGCRDCKSKVWTSKPAPGIYAHDRECPHYGKDYAEPSPSRAGERLLIQRLHRTFNIVIRREGGTTSACDGPDCVVCRAIGIEFAEIQSQALRTAEQERDAKAKQVDELLATLKASDKVTYANYDRAVAAEAQLTARDQTIAQLRELLNARRDDNTKQACDECEHCSRILMCDYHSLLSDLSALTPPADAPRT